MADTGAALFSQGYAEARQRFLAALADAGLAAQAHVHPLRGRDGEELALDVALDGEAISARMLIISSACHGVEGFCGSAVQTMLLHDAAFRAHCRAHGVAVLYLHALNPHGFSWWRRTTHENIDLNRNFIDFAKPLPENPGYRSLAAAIVPPTWPPSTEVEATLADFGQRSGFAALQDAVTGGQYHFPDGLFYGGDRPSWSHLSLRKVLAQHARQCQQLAWIDLHTGLGPSGVGERIFASHHEPVALARARRWWGAGVTSVDEGSSSSSRLSGLMWNAAGQEAPQAQYTGIALEYGTLPLPQMIDALRADQWLENHPGTPAAQRAAIKQHIRDAFYVNTPVWKDQVLAQAREAAFQAVAGLADTRGH
jgi:Protein of unknown function (DUF2817)